MKTAVEIFFEKKSLLGDEDQNEFTDYMYSSMVAFAEQSVEELQKENERLKGLLDMVSDPVEQSTVKPEQTEETEIETLSRRLKNNAELIFNADKRERVRLNLIQIAESLRVENQPEESKPDFPTWLEKEALPATKQILSELRELNKQKDLKEEESKEYQEGLMLELTNLWKCGANIGGLTQQFTIKRN